MILQGRPPERDNKDMRQEVDFKIFSGLHRGARIPLYDGEYAIGADASCDLILRDGNINPNHMLLLSENGKHYIKPEDGPVFIDGRQGLDGLNPVANRSIITIGTIHTAIIERGDDWQPDEFPTTVAAGYQEIEIGEPCEPPKKNKRKTKTLRVLAAIVVAAGAYWFAQGFIRDEEPAYKADIGEIRKLLDSLPLVLTAVSQGKDGYVDVVAYTPTRADSIETVRKLEGMEALIRSTIYVENEIGEMATAYFEKMKYPVRAKYEGAGKFVLKGFAWDTDEIAKISEGLKQNVPGVRLTESEIVKLNEIMPIVENILKQNHLDRKLTVEASPDGLSIKGDLGPDEQKAWIRGKDQIIDRIKPSWKIDDKVHFEEYSDVPGKIALPITSVSLGEKPYVTLEGKRKCFEGGPLKAGAIIRSITSDKVIVQIQGREYFYTY